MGACRARTAPASMVAPSREAWPTRLRNQSNPGVHPPGGLNLSLPELVREELSVILVVNEAGTLKARRASARHDHTWNRDHEWCHSAQARKRLAVSWGGRSRTRVLQEGHPPAKIP